MDERLLLVGTEDGVRVLRHEAGDWRVIAHGLAGHRVWAVAGRADQARTLFAGTYGGGLYQSDDGSSWTRSDVGIDYPHIRSIVPDPRDANVWYVGTEPAAMFRSENGGRSWRQLEAIQDLPGSQSWFLPYSPRRGAMRSIAITTSDPSTIYGGIEQGGVARSSDRGATWELLDGGVHPDVHQLAVSPANPLDIFAATGGGLFRSDDGGESWLRLRTNYVRAVLLNPQNPQQVWAGPARAVGHGGTILRSDDGGNVWHEAASPLPIPMPDMVETFAGPIDNTLLAVTSGGKLLQSPLDRPLWSEVTAIRDVHVVTAKIV